MRTKFMMVEKQHRVFRKGVWIGRAIGWMLMLVAVLGIVQAELLPAVIGEFKLLPSIALGLAAVVWIVGLELFLHFFDRYLSRN